MNHQLKIIVLWLLLVLGITLHAVLENSAAIYYAPLPEEPYGESIPMMMHVIYIMAMVLPMLFVLLTLFITSRAFKIVSLVLASLLALLHVFHALEEGGLENVTQLLILSFTASASVVLVVALVKWLRAKPAI